MAKDRYVVKDQKGRYYRHFFGYSERSTTCSVLDREEYVMTHDKALLLVDEQQVRAHHFEPGLKLKLKLYRLIPRKPKPKAPREVFVLVNGALGLCEYASETFDGADGARTFGDRVVRYVLAEGE